MDTYQPYFDPAALQQPRPRPEPGATPARARRGATAALLGLALLGTTIGGGAVVWPRARADDGLADVVVAPSGISRIRIAAALRSGEPAEARGLVTGRGESLCVRGEPIPYVIDGEPYPPTPSRWWRVHPSAWRLLAPAVDGEAAGADASPVV